MIPVHVKLLLRLGLISILLGQVPCLPVEDRKTSCICTFSGNQFWVSRIPAGALCVQVKNTEEKFFPTEGRVSFIFSGPVEKLEFYTDTDCAFDTYMGGKDVACREEEQVAADEKTSCVQSAGILNVSNIPSNVACLTGDKLQIPIMVKGRTSLMLAESLANIGNIRLFKDEHCSLAITQEVHCADFDLVSCSRTVDKLHVESLPSVVNCVLDTVSNTAYSPTDSSLFINVPILSDIHLEYFSVYHTETQTCEDIISLEKEYQDCPVQSYFPRNSVNEMNKMFDIANVIDSFDSGYEQTESEKKMELLFGWDNKKASSPVETISSYLDKELDFMHYEEDDLLGQLEISMPHLAPITDKEKHFYAPKEVDHYFGEFIIEDNSPFEKIEPGEYSNAPMDDEV